MFGRLANWVSMRRRSRCGGSGRFEGVKEEEERRPGGEVVVERVLLEDFDGRELRCGQVGCVVAGPVGDVLSGDGDEDVGG